MLNYFKSIHSNCCIVQFRPKTINIKTITQQHPRNRRLLITTEQMVLSVDVGYMKCKEYSINMPFNTLNTLY